ncbi:serine/threonine-protein kinase Nek11-like [Physella acuta]|uniref:serine/threonine-protein kinase Nek11-like n=1 Tax=Physella acuta TaxID=109671 RepID=UPI0027DD18CE|nr:serine/threonine-protein kinase Nek11-like [Physella acuta]XP_059142131.1 serine/threonine-protein kinase Nek11-like [Physella acuta]
MPPSRATKDRETKEARVLANRYEIVKKLGSGNFGTAFLCKDKKCNNEFKVLKEISVGELEPDETVDAMHEARILSKLQHPGIVRFHDSFIDGEFFCIITEYCQGGDLDHKITEQKKLNKNFDENTVISWTIQLVLAVQYMHSRRVLHRDLKTRNIFLHNNLLKIGDFGISRILMNSSDMASTFTGTPYYMSPEVLKHEGYNSKSDVWSVGCILYEICSLEHAFMGQGLMAVMYKIVEKDPPNLPSKYSPELNEVFKKMVTKDPEKRPSATDVTKFPFIAKNMVKMKETLTEEYKAKHNLNPETADREALELASLLREKSHLDDLRSTMDKSNKEEETRTEKKKLTARERLILRKREEADKRAQDLKKATKIQLEENAERRNKIKNSFEQTTMPVWKGGEGEGKGLKNALTVKDPRLEHSYYETIINRQDKYGSSEDEGDTVVDMSTKRRSSDFDSDDSYTNSRQLKSKDRLVRTMSDRMPRTLTDRTPNTLSLTMGAERPIMPMKDLMVYNREYSSLDFKDGIPDTPDLADTYYEQFKDFDKDDSEEDDDDNEGTVTVKDDEENFINCLEMALDKDDGESTLVSDDTVSGAFGPAARETKIKNLKGECIRTLGEEGFKQAYSYLKQARTKENKSEKEIMDGLRKLVKNPSDCFAVDQLLFLEEQAKFS